MSYFPRSSLQSLLYFLGLCHMDLQCLDISYFPNCCHDEWYQMRRQHPGQFAATYIFKCLTITFGETAEAAVVQFNTHAAVYTLEEIGDLGIPSRNVFNCTGRDNFAIPLNFCSISDGPEILATVARKALLHCVNLYLNPPTVGLWAVTCNDSCCRASVAVILTLLVAAQRIKPSDVGLAGEYLVHNKSVHNKTVVRKGVMCYSGPVIVEAATLMGPIHLPY
jgi:hypothetical protein